MCFQPMGTGRLMTPTLPLDLLQRENMIETCLICSYLLVLITQEVQ